MNGSARHLIDSRTICARFGICRHTWHRWVVAQHAPAPVPNLPGHPRWRVEDIEAFERGAYRASRYFRGARKVA